MPANVLEGILFLACVTVHNAGAAQKRLERLGARELRQHHAIGFHELDVVDEDLAQALVRVHDVHGTAAILLGHRRSLRQSCVRLFANGGEDLEMVVDAPHLVGDLDQAELSEVPDFGR